LVLLLGLAAKKSQVHAVENRSGATKNPARCVPPGRDAYFWMMSLFMRFAVTCEAEIDVEKLPTMEITNI
jgi:hypothetical protein